MNHLRIEVYGYSYSDPRVAVHKTFYVRDEIEFGERVMAWEYENDIFEWHRN